MDISPEDRADYAWTPPDVQTRLRAGEDVFQSEFEIALYDRLSMHEELVLVPQWKSMGKYIDLVVTDKDGRRLAVEADGELDHMTEDGSLLPEDKNRQELLERAGWVFHRVWYRDFEKNPDGEVARVLESLKRQPRNARLVEREVPQASVTPLRMAVGQTSVDSEPSATAREVEAPTPAPPRSEEGAKILPLRGPEPRREPVSRDSTVGEASLDDVPFRRIAMDIATVVREQGRISEADLAPALAERFRVSIPKARKRMVENKFAWSAKGHGFIDFDTDARVWIPAKKEPDETTGFGMWTMRALIARAAQLLASASEEEVFPLLLEELWPGPQRTPRLAMSLCGTAINEAKREM